MKSLIFRAVVCFVLICCLVINFTPVGVEASVAAATTIATGAVVTGAPALGIAGVLLALGAGVVFTAMAYDTVCALGESMYDFGKAKFAEDQEAMEVLDVWIQGIQIDLTGGPGGSDGSGDDGNMVFPIPPVGSQLYEMIQEWLADLISSGGVKVPGEEAPEGYAYYNGNLRPILPEYDTTAYPYAFIYKPKSYTYNLLYISNVPVGNYGSNGSSFGFEGGTYTYCSYKSSRNVSTGKYGSWSVEFEHATPSAGMSFESGDFIWSNYDIVKFNNLVSVASTPLTQEEAYLEAAAIVGETAQGIQDGTKTEDDIVISEIDYSTIFEGQTDAVEALNQWAVQLADGTLIHKDYLEMTKVQTTTDTETDSSEATNPPEDLSSPVGDVSGTTFFDKLLAVITEPFKWIWGKIETFFTKALKPELWLDPLPEIFLQPFEWIWSKIEPILEHITDSITNAGTKVEGAVNSLVVPEENYLTDKVDSLCAEFAFADSIVRTGQAISTGLAGVTTEPPVIYIDLGATRGSYNIGGSVPFLDLRWYAEYKPTVDIIISAFLWICFIWRMLLKLPGIISGMPGDFVMGSAHAMGVSDMLPSRNTEYEQLRIENRNSIRKGRS